ncbi:MAG: T9SS type A sorting domain-containing protein [Bacteroidetes bacterium]|nr:T9SS type A sorting domain-containing protein [Bacteroidota bacterium]
MKKLIFAICCFLCLICNAQPPSSGLVAFYQLDGDGLDQSNSANDMTPFGSPTYTEDRFGNKNSACYFDGNDDYFVANSVGPLGGTSRTISFWASIDLEFNNDGFAVISYGGENTSGYRFEIGFNKSCKSLYTDVINEFGAKPINYHNGSWHLYTVIFDASSSNNLTNITYYQDTSIISSFCMTPGSISINTQNDYPLHLGRLFLASNPRFFKGKLDEVRIYNRALTASEVQSIYSPTSVSSEPLLHNHSFKIYPNPSRNSLYISDFRTSGDNHYSVKIVSLTGKVLIELESTQSNIELSLSDQLSTGLYYAIIQNENSLEVYKQRFMFIED